MENEENFQQENSFNNQIENSSDLDSNNNNVSEFSIPDEYKDRGWSRFFDGKTGENLKSELFKSYDNSQKLIGKRVEEYLATTDLKKLSNFDEIKKNLSSQLTPQYNTPENAADYDLVSALKDENGNQIFTAPQEALNAFQDKFKEFGISKEQGQNLMKTYLEYEVGEFQKYTNPDELEANINQMFKGNQQQRGQCEALIREFLPPQDQKFIQDTMPNAVVEMFYKITKGLVDKYDYKESHSIQSNSSMRMTNAEKEAEYTRLVSEIEALSHRPHSTQEKQQLLDQLTALYQ